jgi:DNA-binding transcriptional regulator YiaG
MSTNEIAALANSFHATLESNRAYEALNTPNDSRNNERALVKTVAVFTAQEIKAIRQGIAELQGYEA